MKSYLLIDLDKMAKDCIFPDNAISQTMIFAKKKKNRQWAKNVAKKYQNIKSVNIKENEKIASVLVAKVEKLLKKHPAAHILIESPRKKIAKYVDKLLNYYPDAHIVLGTFVQSSAKTDEIFQAGKNTDADNPLLQNSEDEPKQPEKSDTEKSVKLCSENKLIGTPKLQVPDNHVIEKQDFISLRHNATQLPEIKGNRKMKSKMIDMELIESENQPVDLLDKLTQNHQAAEADRKLVKMLSQPEFDIVTKRLDALMNVLKKTHIKKKSTLLQEFMQNLNLNQNEATALLHRLQSLGVVSVDSDTVKFSNLMNLLKLR